MSLVYKNINHVLGYALNNTILVSSYCVEAQYNAEVIMS